jgi:hypothetical protein
VAGSCPVVREFLLTDHARFEMGRRGISEREVSWVLLNPEQAEQQRPGRCVYQARVEGPDAERLYLLRVFVDVDRNPAEVVTAYRTSKVEKYRRHHARDL